MQPMAEPTRQSTQTQTTERKPQANNGDRCEDCGAPMRPDGGCAVCPHCGWSPCG